MPSATPFATNAFSVRTTPIDFTAAGAPTTKTYHGFSIVVNGNIVGRVESWQPQMFSRQGQHVYELNHLTFGRPVDYVPGVNQNYTVTASRTEVWGQEFERALGFKTAWSDLIDQDRPFQVYQYIYKGRDIYQIWVYSGCWFQEKNEDPFQANSDNVRVMVNCTIAFVSRTRTTSG